MRPLNLQELRNLWKAGPNWLPEHRFNRLKELESMNVGPQNVTGPRSTIETYPNDWETYWRNHSDEYPLDYASLCDRKATMCDLSLSFRNGNMTQQELEMYKRIGGRGLQGQEGKYLTWEKYQKFATIVHYQNEVGTPSFTKKKFDKLLHFEKHKGKRSHRTDKLFGHYSNWADYCSRWGGGTAAKGAVSNAAGVSVSGALPSAGGGWADDSGADDDDGAGVPSAMMDDDSDRAQWLAIITDNGADDSGADDDECSSAEAVEDDAGLMMYEDWIQPPEGDWIQPPEGAWSDPKGGMGIPATLADMMSMLHVRLLSLEVGLRSRNLYRAGM
jgi:hypothetical protein